jgi:hypothetical protein
MAYTGVLTTEAEIAVFAGENVDATGNTEANHNLIVPQAESFCCGLSRYNWVDNYADLNADTKKILNEYCARYAAVALIAYNMGGYTSRIEAENMININVFRMRQIEKLLEDQKWVTWATTGGGSS